MVFLQCDDEEIKYLFKTSFANDLTQHTSYISDILQIAGKVTGQV